MDTLEYVSRLEGAIGPCTFPLSEGKIPMKSYSWPEIVEKIPLAIRWSHKYRNSPVAIVTKKLCCLDFDWHEDKNTVPYFNWLVDNKPEVLDGMYIELSKNGGIHVVGWQNEYMKAKNKQYDYVVLINGKQVGIEVKIATHYFVSYPTPGYMPLTKTLVEMIESDELKEMPDHWNKDCREIRRANSTLYKRVKPSDNDYNYGDITRSSSNEYKQFFIKAWIKAYSSGNGRHFGAGMMAKQLYASGCDISLIELAVNDYWKLMNRKPRNGEINEAITGSSMLTGFEKHTNSWVINNFKKTQK